MFHLALDETRTVLKISFATMHTGVGHIPTHYGEVVKFDISAQEA